MRNKKLLYLDMDGVVADFEKSVELLQPGIFNLPEEIRGISIDKICEKNPDVFLHLEPIKDSIEHVHKLFDSNLFDIYFLSTPMWIVPSSFTDKRIWIEKHFDHKCLKRLILLHRKDLNLGDFLVDDRLTNGSESFTGYHIHFGTELFPDWKTTYDFLILNA